jgi:hypothetical protein
MAKASSMRGKIGARIVREEKLRNHKAQNRKRRKIFIRALYLPHC